MASNSEVDQLVCDRKDNLYKKRLQVKGRKITAQVSNIKEITVSQATKKIFNGIKCFFFFDSLSKGILHNRISNSYFKHSFY